MKLGLDRVDIHPVDLSYRSKPIRGKAKKMDFIELGKAAHANGELRAPALNAHVMEAIAGHKVGDPETLRIMNDFSRGYQMGVQAECAAILTAGFRELRASGLAA